MAVKKTRTVIVTSQYRDLYYGEVAATDAEIVKTKAVSVAKCRHIAYWTGPKGGLTGLAAEGPSAQSRIGAECEALITGVAHILVVSPEARLRFAAIKP